MFCMTARSGAHMATFVGFVILLTSQLSPPALAQATTLRISVNNDGEEANGHSRGGFDRWISADGKHIAFWSEATNLVRDEDQNPGWDIFVRNLAVVPPKTTLISVRPDGEYFEGDSGPPAISGNGRYVSFYMGQGSSLPGVFVHDRNPDGNDVFDEGNGVTTRVASSGSTTSLSANGQWIAFETPAALDDSDVNGLTDIYVSDWRAGTMELVSVATDGTQGNDTSNNPSISGDGRFVAFWSDASNLVGNPDDPDDPENDGNGVSDIFVHDRDADGNGVYDETCDGCRKTVRVSLSAAGAEANQWSSIPRLSGTGRHVVFFSAASNLVDSPVSGYQCYVRDRDINDLGPDHFDEPGNVQTTLLSRDSAGTPANAGSSGVTTTADGRFAAFITAANNLVLPDCQNYLDVFVHDRRISPERNFDEDGFYAVTRAGLATNCAEADQRTNAYPAISDDGRFVAFESWARNLVGDDDGASLLGVYVRDRGTCMTPAVTKHPVETVVYYKQTTSLTMAAIGDPTIKYQWRKDRTSLTCDDRISGCDTPTLTIKNAQVGNSGDSGQYDCVVTNDCDCSEVWSAPATLTVKHSLGDMDCSGAVDFNDIDGFVLVLIEIDDYIARYPDCDYLNGDCDHSGHVGFNDIDCFVECLVKGGCN